LNTFGLTKKIVYENEEFNLLQAALNIEDDLDNLRYNKVVIATDADVDGMHIRLLLITFFLKFFPDLIKTEEERILALDKLGKNAEITRFKGLGEISPDEFKNFIGETIRLDPVLLKREESISKMLEFYMGKNTPERQEFIMKRPKAN